LLWTAKAEQSSSDVSRWLISNLMTIALFLNNLWLVRLELSDPLLLWLPAANSHLHHRAGDQLPVVVGNNLPELERPSTILTSVLEYGILLIIMRINIAQQTDQFQLVDWQ
jgi:hypothetical protein